LSLFLNTASDEADVTSLGKPFHTFAPATGKARSPTVDTDGKLERQADPWRRTWVCVGAACQRHMWMTTLSMVVQSRGVHGTSALPPWM